MASPISPGTKLPIELLALREVPPTPGSLENRVAVLVTSFGGEDAPADASSSRGQLMSVSQAGRWLTQKGEWRLPLSRKTWGVQPLFVMKMSRISVIACMFCGAFLIGCGWSADRSVAQFEIVDLSEGLTSFGAPYVELTVENAGGGTTLTG